jgi:hypothetical protein
MLDVEKRALKKPLASTIPSREDTPAVVDDQITAAG